MVLFKGIVSLLVRRSEPSCHLKECCLLFNYSVHSDLVLLFVKLGFFQAKLGFILLFAKGLARYEARAKSGVGLMRGLRADARSGKRTRVVGEGQGEAPALRR